MPADPTGSASQQVRFARSADGVTIAYAVHGSGPPLVLNSCWLSHLEYDWSSPVWRHYLAELGRVLFTDYMFAFEVTSILIILAFARPLITSTDAAPSAAAARSM